MIKRLLVFLTAFGLLSVGSLKSEMLENLNKNMNISGYTQNMGQMPSNVKFYSSFKNMRMFIESNSITFDYYKIGENNTKAGTVVKMNFFNSNTNTLIAGLEKNDYKINVIKDGNTINDISSYSEVKINNLYDGIDLVLKINDGKPRYDFIVHPNADPSKIKFAFSGVDGISLDNDQVVLNTVFGDITHKNLFAYQNSKEINCNFSLKNNVLAFNVGKYDNSKELVIDPVVFCAYIGGTDDDQILKMRYKDNYFYVTGWTLSTDLAVTTGAYESAFDAEKDAFLAKYQIDGLNKKLIYCTYINGSNEDVATGLGIDDAGNIYVAGHTYSDNFPKKGTLGLPYAGGADCFIIKLDKTGANMVYGALFGGSKDDFITDADANGLGNMFFVGYTNSTNLPVTGSAYQLKLKGGTDMLAGKMAESGNIFNYLTYIGGSLDDKANGMKLDLNNNDTYIAGETNSTDIPIKPYKTTGGGWGQPLVVTDAPYDYSANGGIDAVEAQVDNTGSLAICGYFGGKGDDIGKAIDLKEDGSIILAGETTFMSTESKFPISQNAFQKTVSGGVDVFLAVFGPIVTKVTPIQQLSTSTYFGGSGNEKLSSISYSKDQFTIAFCGQTASSDFPKVTETFKNMGSGDSYIAKISPPLTTLSYTNLFGGTGEDMASSMYLDSRGDMIVAGYTKSANLAVAPKGNSSYKGGYDGFIYKAVFGTITAQYPQGGETKCLGENITLKWLADGFGTTDSYDVYLIKGSDSTFLMAIGNTTTSQLAWTIPSTLAPGNDYKIRISHKSGLVAESASAFTLAGPPTIVSFTKSQAGTVLCENSEFKLNVAVNAKNPTFKWYFNGALIATTQDSSFMIPKLALTDAGKYSVSISGACNPAVTSSDITIDVIKATKITKDLVDQTVKKDKPATFSVIAVGTNLTYEWQRNGSKIMSETKADYTIPTASKAMEGKYKCIVKGDCGLVESFEAILSVDTTTSDVFENTVLNDDISVYQLNSDEFEIRINKDFDYKNINVLNSEGKIVYSTQNSGSKSYKVSANNFANGLYIVNTVGSKENKVKKFILTK
jgi:hypothetical protein